MREALAGPHRALDRGRREAVPLVRYSCHWVLPKANEQGLTRDEVALV